MIVAPVHDLDLVKRTIAALWRHVADDLAGSPELFTPRPDAFYLGAWDEDDVFLGLFACVQVTGIVCEMHTCLLPCSWGAKAREAARITREWLWENTAYRKLIGAIPETYRAALKFARDAGMQEYGRCAGAWLKDGRAVDLVLVEVNREA